MDTAATWMAGKARQARVSCERTALLVNAASRRGRERFDDVRAALQALDVTLVEEVAIGDPAALPERLHAAIKAGAGRIIVGGGDGTLSTAASELAGRDVVMGVVPLGTCNDFARSLNLPTDVLAACRVAISGEARAIDLGTANGRCFLNAASIGLSSAVARRLSGNLKRKLGAAAVAVAAAGEAWQHQPFRATLEIDGNSQTFDAHQVVVGNGPYHGGGRMVAPGASHEDRRLDVYVIRSTCAAVGERRSDRWGKMRDRWNLFRIATLLPKGRHVDHPAVTHLRATRVTLLADPKQQVNLDGELRGETPVDFELLPGALSVMVPRVGG